MLETEHCYLSAPRRPEAPAPLPVIDPAPASPATPEAALPAVTLHELEKRHIFATLERCQNNRTQAAKFLDISVRTLRNKLHEYGAAVALSEENEPEELAAGAAKNP